MAYYTFDFADRESTLEAEMPDTSVQSIVTSSTYYPFGPLRLLELGNGVLEEHRFDSRYFPDEIEVTAQKSHLWAYIVDGVGNPTEIEETESCLPTFTLSNQALSGTKSFIACDELTASPDVTIETGADVTFAADHVGLGNGFSVAQGALFSVVAGTPLPIVATRTYGYQDYQYFLTSADGAPWGSLGWTYDRIGNRLSEDRNSVVDTYTYVTNGGGGNTAKLAQAGSRVFAYDNAGNTTQMTAGANQINYGIDDASRIAEFARPVATAETTLTYDGRSFLDRSEELLSGGPDLGFAEPTYSTEGVIHSLHRQSSPTDPEERTGIFYFAGRPVAQRHEEIGASSTWLFLSTDHLMTPSLATGLSVAEEWHGPFEPFGRDSFSGTNKDAIASGVFLRLPGQWADRTWEDPTLGNESFYNVFRWYLPAAGRYSRSEPLNYLEHATHYLYVFNSPLALTDPRGLQPEGGVACSQLGPVEPECCDGSKVDRGLGSARRLRAFYCANRGKPRAEPKPRPGQVFVQIGGIDPVPWYRPQGDLCLDRCICAHEGTHWRQLRSASREGWDINALECEAWGVSIRCLSEARRKMRPIPPSFLGLPIH